MIGGVDELQTAQYMAPGLIATNNRKDGMPSSPFTTNNRKDGMLSSPFTTNNTKGETLSSPSPPDHACLRLCYHQPLKRDSIDSSPVEACWPLEPRPSRPSPCPPAASGSRSSAIPAPAYLSAGSRPGVPAPADPPGRIAQSRLRSGVGLTVHLAPAGSCSRIPTGARRSGRAPPST